MPALTTKLHVPAPRSDLVARTRLRERLEAAEHASARLILISAPAGFGKTTVLSQWLAPKEGEAGVRRIAWVALDRGDNDLRRFLVHVLAAFHGTNGEVGQEAQEVLDAADMIPTDAVLTSLINDLDTLADETVLALDDYHEITHAAVHEALGFLLDHLPRHVRLAVTTRSDPPLPLARLRSSGGLVELRAAELRFTAEEADSLFNGVMGLGLEAHDIDVLDERTEGWAAGLQLAALSLRGRDDAEAFVNAFAGSHRFVLDYLLEEVLNRQSDAIRDFLLDTAILKEMTAPLCDALTGRADSSTLLETLERDNLFLVPLDDHRTWYRYHHLFGDALRTRLQSQRPDRVATLHGAASRWLAQQGRIPDAVTHAAASGDVARTTDLVELALPDLRRHRQADIILDWIQAIPTDVIRRRPLLATVMAWSKLSLGNLDEAETWLDRAERALSDTEAITIDVGSAAMSEAAKDLESELRQLPAMIEVYWASVAQARGDVDGTVAHARRALDLCGPDDHVARGGAAGFLGLAAWAAGDLTTAVETFNDAVVSMHAAGAVADELGSTVVLANMWVGRGRPDEAGRLLERALATAERHLGRVLPTTGDLHVGLAEVRREQGDLAAAAQHLETARTLGDSASVPENRHRWYVAMAGVHRARGDFDGAIEMLELAEPLYQPGFFPDMRPIPAVKARLRILQGDLEGAAQWARGAGVTVDTAPRYLDESNQLTLARLVVAEHRADSARRSGGGLGDVLSMLDNITEIAEKFGRAGSLVEARMVRALAYAEHGATDAALDDLAAALCLGVPAGYCRLILDEGRPIDVLLRGLAADSSRAEAATHAGRLLSAAEQVSRPAVRSGAADADEAISERELEVLRLLRTDLTGPEIARQLFVSVNTLRTHTKHIFTKLDVNTRRAAVSKANDLQLL